MALTSHTSRPVSNPLEHLGFAEDQRLIADHRRVFGFLHKRRRLLGRASRTLLIWPSEMCRESNRKTERTASPDRPAACRSAIPRPRRRNPRGCEASYLARFELIVIDPSNEERQLGSEMSRKIDRQAVSQLVKHRRQDLPCEPFLSGPRSLQISFSQICVVSKVRSKTSESARAPWSGS